MGLIQAIKRVAFLAVFAPVLIAPAVPQSSAVDMALVIAIDCSYSVDSAEHRLQMEGFGAALQDPQVMDAVLNGPQQRIAITVFQWSDADNQRVIIPWTVIDGAEAAASLGKKLAQGRRDVPEGGTGISAALIYGAAQFAIAPPAQRFVIDLSTDGRNNMGAPTPLVRDRVLARNITINALAVTNEWPALATYLERQVTGGPGNFVISAGNYDDFGAAMLKKLVKEITGPGLT